MRKIFKWLLFIVSLIVIVLLWITFHHPYIHVTDNFEAPKLSKIWSTSRMEDPAFEIQSGITRTGKTAAKITLRNGDIVEAATVKDKASERDELMEAMSLYAIAGKTYEYKFSMFLPDSFPILPTRLVIAQWKEFCPFCSCSEYSPVVAVRYVSGRLYITLQTDTLHKTVLYELKQEIRNRWLDFSFLIRFSQQSNGLIKAFLNQQEIINYTGITSYQNDCRILSDKNKYYFKMGLYRDRVPEPMCIYLDDYSKKEIE